MERYVELLFLSLVLFSLLLVIDVVLFFFQNFHFLSNGFMAVFQKGFMQF